MKLNHLNLCVDSINEARAFFENYFGLECLDQRKDAIAVLTDNQGFTLVLSHLSEVPVQYPEGFHVGFIVGTPEEVDAVHKRLAEGGIGTGHAPKRARNSYAFYFTALNSILFEVSCEIA